MVELPSRAVCPPRARLVSQLGRPLGLLAFVLLFVSCAGSPPPAVVPADDTAGEVAVRGLLQLPGQRAQVRYSPGSLDRGARTQQRLALLAEDWRDWTGRELVLGAYVLTREEWEGAGLDRPYGQPQRVGRLWIALPAEGDATTVTLWEQALGGGLPAAEGLPLRGTPQEASSMGLADLSAQRELALGLIELEGLAEEASPVREVLAHVVAGASFLRWERPRLGEVAGMYRRAAGAHAPAAGAAGAWDAQTQLGPWLARQAGYYDAAQLVLAEAGDDAPKKLIRWRRRLGRALTAADLVERYPALAGRL
jgi:hypothetical protein